MGAADNTLVIFHAGDRTHTAHVISPLTSHTLLLAFAATLDVSGRSWVAGTVCFKMANRCTSTSTSH
jgi:hypothetical protein